MSRIAFFCGDITRSGGTERVTCIIASGLAAKGHEVSIVSLMGSGEPYFSLSHDVSVYYVGSNGFTKGIAGSLSALKRYISKEGIAVWIDVDIILCYYSMFLKKAFPKMKWIGWEHFNYDHKYPYYRGLRRLAKTIVTGCADVLVVLSESDLSAYREHHRLRCEARRIYNPTPYEPDMTSGDRQKLFLACGRLTYVKGFDLLLLSWKRIYESHPDYRLVIVGEGEDRDMLLSIIEKEGLCGVELFGRCTDMESLYRQAYAFLLPSRSEGMPMVVLEALAFGLPVVAYHIEGGLEEMIRTGEDGFLIEDFDTTAFADAAKSIIEDEKKCAQMREAAICMVKSFSVDSAIADWEEIV